MAARAPLRRCVPPAAALLTLLGLLGAGCAAPPAPSSPAGPLAWPTRAGQAVWQPRRAAPAIAGELVLARGDAGDFVLQFSKPPVPLVEARRTGAHWEVAFPAGGRRVRGRGPGPTRLLWLWLPVALEGGALPRDLGFTWEGENWRLVNPRTGESLAGYLAP